MRSHRPLNPTSLVLLGAIGLAVVAGACANQDTTSGGSGGSSATTTTTSAGGATSTSTTSDGGTDIITGPGSGGGAPCSPGAANDDSDGDGFTEDQGDCNDCDSSVNPDAIEVEAEADAAGNKPPPADEDCDGHIDNLPGPCDGALTLASEDAMDGARAIGACTNVTKASWVLADGTPPPVNATQLAKFHLGHGILNALGPNNGAKEGTQLLALSSGTARNVGDPEYVHRNFDKGYSSNPPFGFPKESSSCPGITTALPHDATGLELEFKAPSNAKGISFDFNFFTFEWPKFICTKFNDFFVANLSPFPEGQTDGNISFDSMLNPVSVNNAFLDACGCPGNPPSACNAPQQPQPGQSAKAFDCMLGTQLLEGTDFVQDENNPGWTNGATGWLRTSAPVVPGATFTLRFVTYDSSDGFVDSTTLIDNWKWSAKPGTVQTIIPN